MATLTATELADIRDVIGDTNTPPHLTDAKIQAQYDLAASDLTLTYVYTLRRLWGRLRQIADRTTEHGDNELDSQKLTNTKALLDYWEAQAGLYGGNGGLFAGVIDLDLDTDDTDTS